MLQKAEDAVRAYIIDAIHQGEFRPHAQLPAERTLADRIGVSRAAVRQALTVLEAEGKIYRHVGRGTFIAEGISQATASIRPGIDTSPSKLIEARSVIEVRLAELVVLNATEGDLRAIRAASDALSHVSDALEFEHADGKFHRTIAQACHNELLVSAYDLVDRARRDPEWLKLKVLKNQHADARKVAVRHEHQVIVDALEARDRTAAAAAMQIHLLNVRNNLLGF